MAGPLRPLRAPRSRFRLANDTAYSKTFWTSVAGILGAAAAHLAGQINTVQMLGAIWMALQVFFVRDTVSKGQGN